MMRNLRALILVVLLSSFFAMSCSTAPYTGRKQLSLIPRAQLDAMGTQAFTAALRQNPTANDPKVEAYVKCVTDPIVNVVSQDNKDVAPESWKLAVIKNDAPNAFALPGGNIGVHTGILNVAKDDAQLAAVIAHELGHVIANHGGERVSQSLIAQGGLTIAQLVAFQGLSPASQNMVMAALGMGTQVGVLLPFGRKQESEADIIGLHLMAKAGYNPNASIGLWENMIAQAKGGKPPEFLSTHPSSESRIESLKSEMPKAFPEYQAASRVEGRKIASGNCSR